MADKEALERAYKISLEEREQLTNQRVRINFMFLVIKIKFF
jgi:hypothetical protein